MRCLLVIWEPQYLRKKKKVSWFSWNQLSWQTDQCSVTWECCLPILLLREIIFNSQLTISIPRKPVSWRMRNYCAEDPIYIFFLFPWVEISTSPYIPLYCFHFCQRHKKPPKQRLFHDGTVIKHWKKCRMWNYWYKSEHPFLMELAAFQNSLTANAKTAPHHLKN